MRLNLDYIPTPSKLTRLFAALLIAMGAAIAAPAPGESSEWRPERGVELIVPSAPGGGNDRTARTVQRLIEELDLLDVPIAVVNRPGGGHSVAYSHLQQHPGDAHYLSMSTLNLITNRIMGTNPINYRDVTPIAQLTQYALAYAVAADSPIQSAEDLVSRLQEDPGSVTFASAGGAFAIITTGLLAMEAGIDVEDLRHVVLGSGGEAMTALLGGHVDVVAASPSGILPHYQSGAARLVGVSGSQRQGGAFTEVPTLQEQGVNVVSSNWYNIIAPPDLKPEQVAFWEEVLEQVTSSGQWREEVERNIWEDSFLTSADLLETLQAQEEQVERVLKNMGLAADQ